MIFPGEEINKVEDKFSSAFTPARTRYHPIFKHLLLNDSIAIQSYRRASLYSYCYDTLSSLLACPINTHEDIDNNDAKLGDIGINTQIWWESKFIKSDEFKNGFCVNLNHA